MVGRVDALVQSTTAEVVEVLTAGEHVADGGALARRCGVGGSGEVELVAGLRGDGEEANPSLRTAEVACIDGRGGDRVVLGLE